MMRSAFIFTRGCVATRFLPCLALCLLACLGAPPAVIADGLRIVAPSAPGSSWDQLAQALKSALADERGETVVDVRNVPGAGGTVGLAKFLAEPSDDALLITGLTMVNAAALHRLPIGPEALTPVARLSAEPFAVAVANGSAHKTIDDLAMAMRADPAKLTWAGGPVGSIDHAAAILLTRALGVGPARLGYAPFLSSHDAAAALADSQVSAIIAPLSELAADGKTGRLRILAVSASGRLAEVEAPTLLEFGIQLELSNWRGVLAHPSLDAERRAKLLSRIKNVVASRAWKEMLDKRGWQNAFLSDEAFGQFISREQARMKAALKMGGLLKRPTE